MWACGAAGSDGHHDGHPDGHPHRDDDSHLLVEIAGEIGEIEEREAAGLGGVAATALARVAVATVIHGRRY